MNTVSGSKSERIISFITESIRNGEFKSGEAIPSISSSAKKFVVARKTVVRAYEKLKNQGLIESRPKTGFFVINKRPNKKQKVLLIIHSFDGHWETLYNAFREKAGDYCDIEVYFHHYNINMLEMIITRNLADYDLFIVSSFNHPRIKGIIGRIPSYKVLIISRNDRLDNTYNSIIQDFKQGTFNALAKANEEISKYKKITLSFPEKGWHSEILKEGFVQYCEEYSRNFASVNTMEECKISKDESYLVINDKDLIHLLRVCKSNNWEIGKDVGVISYNETPYKEVIQNGISVISCNFILMADRMADFIRKQITMREIIPIEFINRNSL